MNNFFDAFAEKLDIYIIGIVLISGFFQKRYFKGFYLNKKDSSYDSALKTLALSFVACIVYLMLTKKADNANHWAKYFISYFAATSLYELLVDPFVKWIKAKTGSDINPEK
jgi:hypothetical protein